MKFAQIPKDLAYEYVKICEECKKDHFFYSQKDNRPEYYTEIYYKCECGNYIECIFPVN